MILVFGLSLCGGSQEFTGITGIYMLNRVHAYFVSHILLKAHELILGLSACSHEGVIKQLEHAMPL